MFWFNFVYFSDPLIIFFILAFVTAIMFQLCCAFSFKSHCAEYGKTDFQKWNVVFKIMFAFIHDRLLLWVLVIATGSACFCSRAD